MVSEVLQFLPSIKGHERSMRVARLCAILVLFPLTAANAQPENPGPRQPGWTSSSIQRDGRTLSCRIYYPAFVEGAEAQIDTVHGPYPIVAFGHGFLMQTSYYISHYRQLATRGFVVIAPQFPDNQHGELANDLLYCVEYLRQQHSSASSRFRGLLDTASAGLSGHSMGGGASLLAAARDMRVRVVAPLAAAETSPSAIAVMSQIRGVVYLIAGGSDGITPPATNQIPMYRNANPIKALVNIAGANHTRFMDVATFDFTDPNGWLSRAEQLLITRRYLTSALSLVLKTDSSFWPFAFGDSARSDSRIAFSYALGPSSVPPVESPRDFALQQNYPNPFNAVTRISFSVARRSAVLLRVIDVLGREIAVPMSGTVEAGRHDVDWDASGQPSGVYFCQLTADRWSQTRAMLLCK